MSSLEQCIWLLLSVFSIFLPPQDTCPSFPYYTRPSIAHFARIRKKYICTHTHIHETHIYGTRHMRRYVFYMCFIKLSFQKQERRCVGMKPFFGGHPFLSVVLTVTNYPSHTPTWPSALKAPIFGVVRSGACPRAAVVRSGQCSVLLVRSCPGGSWGQSRLHGPNSSLTLGFPRSDSSVYFGSASLLLSYASLNHTGSISAQKMLRSPPLPSPPHQWNFVSLQLLEKGLCFQ